KQDAYTIVRLGHDVQRTPTDKRAGQVPSWNHEMRFKVPNEQENLLKISVFNEDSKAPDLIGDCAIDLTAIWRAHEYDSWFDLKYKGKPAGEIYAELTFY
ncbi:C2 domain-containing protein, partial [Protomyces lactucae-debilis]